MDSHNDEDIYKLLGCVGADGELLDFPEWDLLHELDRREKMKNSPTRKEANRRAHRHSLSAKRYNQRYQHDVVSPRRKATRAWMVEHPEEVNEIEARRMQELSSVQ